MKFLNAGNVIRLPLDAISVEGRLREVRDAFVENLIVMAEDTGITTPIHVRKVKDRYVLIDGAHRLEAARRMGLPDIAVLVVECRADEARAMEATNNLGAARMTPLQTAVFVASWKRDYYALHPERKPGVFKGNQYTGKVVGGKMPVTTSPLTKTIADAFGVDESTIFRALKAGENLTPEDAARLDAAPCRITMQDLKTLARIGDAAERSAVVLRLASGNAKSAADARKSLAAEDGRNTPEPIIDPTEAEFRALLNAWSRSRVGARRRFVSQAFHQLASLLRDEADSLGIVPGAIGRDVDTLAEGAEE